MKQRFPERQRDADTSAAIVARLSFTPPFSPDEQLAIYQGRKLEVFPLQPVGHVRRSRSQAPDR